MRLMKKVLVLALLCIGYLLKVNGTQWNEPKKFPIITSVCENEKLQLACEHGQTLQITKAEFGRKGNRICNHQRFGDVHCSVNVTQQLSQKCNNFNRCDLRPAYNLPGYDPCPNIAKYLQITAVCTYSTKIYTKPLFPLAFPFLPNLHVNIGF